MPVGTVPWSDLIWIHYPATAGGYSIISKHQLPLLEPPLPVCVMVYRELEERVFRSHSCVVLHLSYINNTCPNRH